jgi:dienelactone hydrolase
VVPPFVQRRRKLALFIGWDLERPVEGCEHGIVDRADQARDISFVISSLLGGRAGPVDPTRIAVAGHSDGGTDVALLSLNPAFADSRVRAYLCLAGEIPPGVPGPWTSPTAGALLVAVGTDDEYGLSPKSTMVFQTAKVTAKVMLTVAGGDHLGTFIGPSPPAAAMRTETVRFLDTALGKGNTTSADLAVALSPTGDPAIAVSAG